MNNEKLEVICDSVSQHPHCLHGPTLLFRRKNTDNKIIVEYYACSAYRSLDGCKFYLSKSDYDEGKGKKTQYSSHHLEYEKVNKIREKIHQTLEGNRRFCHTCNILFEKEEIHAHKRHDVTFGISDKLLNHPTELLRPLSDNKAEAQYFFTEDTLKFFMNLFKDLKISKICCIGAPRLYERLKFSYKNYGIDGMLLDLDHRFFYFFDNYKFAWFNMFNFHFFEGNVKRDVFEKFLQVENEQTILLFVDPPFGCRTEALVQTIKQISMIYKRINSFSKILPIIWIFPYFMEIYIKKFMPEMEMIDYKINYDNHDQYSSLNHNSKARKHGSPVRLFTNISIDLITLPQKDGYKFCSKCNKWSYKDNIHCDSCKECPSKNGETYRHCYLCGQCVKPSYQHCLKCGRCVQQRSQHSCDLYQNHANCWICKRHGHVEVKCEDWFKYSRKHFRSHRNILEKTEQALAKGYRICLICMTIGDHNERKCPKRKYFLKERHFLSKYVNIFGKE